MIKNSDQSTPIHANEYHPDTFDGGKLGLSVKAYSGSTSSHVPEPFRADETPESILKPVEDRARFLQESLSETTGQFDPRTGKPLPRVQGPRRQAFERELDNILTNSLPYARRQAAAAAAYHAERPTTLDKLQAAKDSRDRAAARAAEMLEEEEAQKIADRLRRVRGNLGIHR